MAELLVWPALLAYGVAALAYAADLRWPGRASGLGIWGVRVGWLTQTALLAEQALRADGFPWGTWAGALNLFVWLVVGAYLVWGCNVRYRLLGVAVMPLSYPAMRQQDRAKHYIKFRKDLLIYGIIFKLFQEGF